ncbi:MAG: recombinase RecT [Phycisphaerales bacterium]|nr:recombinase RecT [Phycisphaerales bacterium]
MNDVATTQAQKEPNLSQELEILKPEIEKVLPTHVSSDKFMRVVMTAISQTPELYRADRRSLLTSCVKAATDGLVPDGREAALVMFGNKATYMPMTAGILKKVRNSGELLSLMSNVVYEKDEFEYFVDDIGEHVLHKPNMLVDSRGNMLAVYAVAKTKDGGVYVEVMSRSQVEQVRNVSRAKNNGPWKDWYDEMARKTVIRRLAKRLPMSTDLEAVIQRDDDLYDLNRGRENHVDAVGGVAGAKSALGIPSFPSFPDDDTVDVDEDGVVVDSEKSAGEELDTAIPQYDEATAIEALESKRTLKTLAVIWQDVQDDYQRTKRDLPPGIEARYLELKAGLEQKDGAL